MKIVFIALSLYKFIWMFVISSEQWKELKLTLQPNSGWGEQKAPHSY